MKRKSRTQIAPRQAAGLYSVYMFVVQCKPAMSVRASVAVSPGICHDTLKWPVRCKGAVKHQ